MKVSLDETVFGWKCHWMKSILDESVFYLRTNIFVRDMDLVGSTCAKAEIRSTRHGHTAIVSILVSALHRDSTRHFGQRCQRTFAVAACLSPFKRRIGTPFSRHRTEVRRGEKGGGARMELSSACVQALVARRSFSRKQM